MKILVIGGAGYIGSHVNKLLHHHGHQTVVYDNLENGHRDAVKWGDLVVGDTGDANALRTCFQTHTIDAVMHFAAYLDVGESVREPEKYHRNNVLNTLNILTVMREFNVHKMVFSSTAAVYGIPQTTPISESHPLAPINPYGASKAAVEQALQQRDRDYGLRSVSLRYFNAAGADPDGELGERHDPETHLIPLAIASALGERDALSLYGDDYPTKDGTCVRDYIHVSDLADAHVRALHFLERENLSEVFNLGNANGYSVREVIESVERVSGKVVPVTHAARREGDPPVLIADARKARERLAWVPRYPDLDRIVSDALNCRTRHPALLF